MQPPQPYFEGFKMIDLATLDVREACDKPFEFELEHPATKKGIGSFVSILGCESGKIREHERIVADQRLAELQEGKKRRSPEEGVQRIIDVAVVATVGWKNIKHKDLNGGKVLEFNLENVKALYSIPGLDWIPVQIYQKVQELESFMKG